MTRARSRYLVKRDKMPPVPCLLCNAEPAQRHHPDYSNPRLVVWLCAPCHRALHQHWKTQRTRTFSDAPSPDETTV